jgi:glycosyltransferase involved in cell wall biosynthesis
MKQQFLLRGRKINEYYKKPNVFLFPTLSDGFGLTQLEARAWQLPLIVSNHCGEVVTDGKDGWVLDEVTAHSIASVIHKILLSPDMLARYAAHVDVTHEVNLVKLLEEIS